MTEKAEKAGKADAPYPLPRVTIKFCTQCKWMLRAAYFAQELLSTFSTSLGEVALQPSTGGTFVVEIFHQDPSTASTVQSRVLWDRKTDGGFPETKELKRRVRDVIEPGRDLGHVDRHARTKPAPAAGPGVEGGAGARLPSRSELEAVGRAGGGYPGSSEAAAQPVGELMQKERQGGECVGKEACEDCR